MRLAVCLVFLVSALLGAEAAKILGVFHPAAPSHFICGGKLLKTLAKKGHEITMISPFPSKSAIENYKDVHLSGFVEQMEGMQKKMAEETDRSILESMSNIFEFGPMLAEKTLNHTNVQKLLKSNEKFDLIIMEAFLNEVHLGFAHHFKAPIVILSTVGANPWVNQYTGNPAPSSYVSELLLSFSGKMTFLERLQNLLFGSALNVYTQSIYMKNQNELLHKYFPDAPHIKDMFKDVAMVLLNSHVSVSPPKPHVPSMVEIGGFHVDDVKELPKDLKDYLDSCKEGFILFSMGSNFQSKNLAPETLATLLRVFEKLPYKVLWKFEAPNLPGKPANVRIEKWLPQNDVLAHKNIKLFITHGGLLSTTEAVYHGVPIVGIPIFGDQKMNMARSVQLGIGKTLELKMLEEKALLGLIKEVIDNPNYRLNARKRSIIMRDQPLKPIDSAVFWVEHVLRHKGADHFKTGALELYWYELYQLDVLALILVAAFLALFIPCKIIKAILCRKSKPKPKAEKKKKQ